MQIQSEHNKEAVLERKRRIKRWKIALTGLMAIVVFVTTYALILPAITMIVQGQVLNCPLYVHEHKAECYDDDGLLCCGQADFVVHTHDESCYDGDGTLVCTLPEVKEHTHDDNCYSQQIACGMEEGETHTHTESCYEDVVVCGKDEVKLHTHTDACYEAIETASAGTVETDAEIEPASAETDAETETARAGTTETDAEIETASDGTAETDGRVLVCGELEVKEHAHGEGCFENVSSDEQENATEQESESAGAAENKDTNAQASENTGDAENKDTDAQASENAGAAENKDTDAQGSESTGDAENTDAQTSEDTTESAGTNQNTTARRKTAAAVTDPELSNCQEILDVELGVKMTTPEIEAGKVVYFRLPGDGHSYTVQSYGSYNTKLTLYSYDTSLRNVATVTSGGDGSNFKLSNRATTVGTTYYFGVYFNSASDTGSFEVKFERGGNHTFTDDVCACGVNLHSCGALYEEDTVTWYVDDENVLHIEGNGPMMDYYSSNSTLGSLPPWDSYATELTGVVVGDGVTSIGNYAFYDKDSKKYASIRNVTLPNSLESIGNYAFYQCLALRDITLPDSLVSIGDYAFYGCRTMTTVTIPGNVSYFGSYAFYQCLALTDLTVKSGVTNIGNYAFTGCSKLEYITLPNTLTQIGESSFQNCSLLSEIELPDSLTSIGSKAFQSCVALTEIKIPEKITTLSSNTFYGCTKLESVDLPDSLKTIGASAFYNCTALPEIFIPDSVTSIGSSAFAGCKALASVNIPDGITTLSYAVFKECTSLTEIEIPDSVTTMESNVFQGCTSLKEMVLPNGITSVGSYAFNNCTSLQSINWPETLTTINSYTFSNCTLLSSFDFPAGLKKIDIGAFSGCKSLKQIDLPDGLETLGAKAFSSCSGLTEVVVPDSVTTMGTECFSGCTSLRTAKLPSSMTKIPDSTFASCTNLTEFTIEEGVTAIGASAFQSCKGLESITFPSSVTTIGTNAFNACYGLTELTLPENVATVGSASFANCTNVAELTIQGQLGTVYNNAFNYMGSLRRIIIRKDNLTTLSTAMFTGCSMINDIVIGKEVTTLTGDTLTQLANISTSQTKVLHFEGPNTIQFTGSDAKLDTVTMTEGTYYVNEDGVLYRLEEDGTAVLVYCPSDLEREEYDSLLTTLVTEDQGEYTVTQIDKYAFADNPYITEINIPESVTTIGSYAFYGCENLASVNGETTMKAARTTLTGKLYSLSAFFKTAIWDALADGETDTGLYTPDSSTTTTKNEDTNHYIFEASIGFATADLVGDGSNTAYTGKEATITINLDDTDKGVDDTLRVYFQMEDGCNAYNSSKNTLFGYVLDTEQTFVVNGQATVTGVFKADDEPNLYYLELVDVKIGDTLNLTLTGITYTNFTAGGTLSLWTDNSQGSEAPETVAQAKWVTTPDSFNSSIAQRSNFTFNGGGTENKDAYLSGVGYKITLSESAGAGGTNYGRNPIDHVMFSAKLTLPETLYWKDGVVNAVKNGEWKCVSEYNNSSYAYQRLYIKLDGNWVEFAYLSASDSNGVNYLDSGSLSVDEDGNIIVGWRRHNPSKTSTITTTPVYLGVVSGMIWADVDKLEAEMEAANSSSITVRIPCELNETGYLRYENETSSLTLNANNSGYTAKGNYTLSKGGTTAYMGSSSAFSISLSNSSIFPVRGIDQIKDSIPNNWYIKPANIERMFNDTYGSELTMKITNGWIRDVQERTVVLTNGKTGTVSTEYLGDNTTYSSENTQDPCGEGMVDIAIQWSADKKYLELEITPEGEDTYVRTVGDGGDYASMTEAFSDIHFDVYNETTYDVSWLLSADDVIYGGETRTIYIYSTMKSTPMMLTQDGTRTSTYDSEKTNVAYSYVDGQYSRSATAKPKVKPEMTLSKSALVNGASFKTTSKLKAGDIISYTDKMFLNTTYSGLPLVDLLHAGQTLLVSADDNPDLAEKGLDSKTVDGVRYYLLNKEGTYTGVKVGNGIADTVEVTSVEGGMQTQIYWYLYSHGSFEMNYRAIVTPDSSSENAKIDFTILAESWLGDHQGHRLYHYISYDGTLLSIGMNIVTNIGSEELSLENHDPDKDELTERTLVEAGDKVVYRLTINDLSEDYPITVTGNNLKQQLPRSVSNYWNKENVSVTYFPTNTSDYQISDASADGWRITTSTVDSSGATSQELKWNDDFSVTFSGTLYIYVTVDFPGAETTEWEDYLDTQGSESLYARFYVSDIYTSQMEHILCTKSVGVLQQGIFRTGCRTNSTYYENTNENARQYYANDSAYDSVVTYYVAVYNGGKGRLYLNDIQVVLPKGFTYYNYSVANANSSVIVKSAESGETLSLTTVGPKINAASTQISEDISGVTLSIDSSSYNDTTLNKFYLKSGQYLVITFDAYTDTYENTLDSATSIAALSMYDYCGYGCQTTSAVEFTPKNTTSITANDGTQAYISNEQAASLGVDTDGYGTDDNWLESEVTLLRGDIKLGLEETCDVTEVKNQNPVSWKVKITNTGDQTFYDYTVTNVMMQPYTYTDNVKYTITPPGSSSGRTSTLLSQSDLPEVGEGEKSYTNSYFGEFTVRLDENEEDETLVMTIHFKSTSAGIPSGGSGVLAFTTTNETSNNYNKDFINKTYLTPNAQTLKRSKVTQGNYVLYDVYDDVNDAVPSITSEARVGVSFGYATTATTTVTELQKVEEDGNILLDTTTNTAQSNSGDNYIVPSSTDNYFRYTLTVNNSGGQNASLPMSLFVLVDNLPEENDHSTLYRKYSRYSEFLVNFAEADLLDPEVTLVNGKTVRELESDEYELLFSAQTDFDYNEDDNSAIWTGQTLSEEDGWYTLEQCKEDGTLQQMRSLRLVIKDPDYANNLMPASSTVNVSFNTTIQTNADAEESQTAWNSFGYLYQVSNQLQAATESVGIKTPGVPELKKELVDYTGKAYEAEKDEYFDFLIYKGEGEDLDLEKGADALFTQLAEEDIPATMVTIKVPEGKSASDAITLAGLYQYERNEETGVWEPGSTRWNWEDQERYTILEIPQGGARENVEEGEASVEVEEGEASVEVEEGEAGVEVEEGEASVEVEEGEASVEVEEGEASVEVEEGEAGGFRLRSINGSKQDSLSFGYVSSSYTELTAVNEKSSWKILLFKESDTGAALSGARFALYTKNQEIAPSEDTEIPNSEDAKRKLRVNGTTWYLMDAEITDNDGIIQWEDLQEDEYYLLELEAPENFAMGEEPGQVVAANVGGTREVTVVNYTTYELPNTGGHGRRLICIEVGVVLVLFTTGALLRNRRKGKRC
jgi:hypothetical protein